MPAQEGGANGDREALTGRLEQASFTPLNTDNEKVIRVPAEKVLESLETIAREAAPTVRIRTH